MRKAAWSLLFVGALAGGVAYAPAALLGRLLSSIGEGRVALGNTAGTLWTGSGRVALKTRDGRFRTLGDLRWHFDWAALRQGRLAMLASWGEAAQEATLVFAYDHIELKRLELMLPAATLGAFSPYLQPLQLDGTLTLRAERVQFSRNGIEGDGVADWRHASSGAARMMALGDYRMTLHGAGRQVQIDLSTLDGDLLLAGRGNWQFGGAVAFEGNARASESGSERLDGLLALIGPQISPGVRRIALTH